MGRTQKRRSPAGVSTRKRRAPAAKRPTEEVRSAPEVVYTRPDPINRKKLILRLTTVVAVVAALFLCFSVFFKVEKIVVSGNEKYSAWAVEAASGIKTGDGLLSFGKAKAAGRITRTLPYVKSVRVGITLPNRVNIHIEELDVVYAAQDQAEQWWLITADGRIVEKTAASDVKGKTLLKGFALQEPKAGEQAKAAQATEQTEETGSAVTNAQRLETALTITAQLELNGILGEVTEIDVTELGGIELRYGERYQVKLGAAEQLEKKIATMKSAVDEMGSYQSGVLDVSFTTYPDGVGYKPFD